MLLDSGICLPIFFISISIVIGDFGYHECQQRTWSEKYKLCAGKLQSPIAIKSLKATSVPLPALEMVRYHNSLPGKLLLRNSGHSVALTFHGDPKERDVPYIFGGVFDRNKTYEMDHIHFHWGSQNIKGSEHTLNGIRFPMEMHILHINQKYKTFQHALNFQDGLAVLGVFFQLQQEDNPVLNPILKALPEVRVLHKEVQLNASIVLSQLMPENTDSYYAYKGSLTTPPCSEVVTWVIFPKPVPISFRQMCKFRSVSGNQGRLVNNYRKLQDVGTRKVYSRLWNPGMKMQYNMSLLNSTLIWF